MTVFHKIFRLLIHDRIEVPRKTYMMEELNILCKDMHVWNMGDIDFLADNDDY